MYYLCAMCSTKSRAKIQDKNYTKMGGDKYIFKVVWYLHYM